MNTLDNVQNIYANKKRMKAKPCMAHKMSSSLSGLRHCGLRTKYITSSEYEQNVCNLLQMCTLMLETRTGWTLAYFLIHNLSNIYLTWWHIWYFEYFTITLSLQFSTSFIVPVLVATTATNLWGWLHVWLGHLAVHEQSSVNYVEIICEQ